MGTAATCGGPAPGSALASGAGAGCLMCCRLPRRYPCIDTCAAQAHLVRGCSQALRWVISSTPLTVSRVYCTVCLHCTVCIMLCCTVVQVSTDGSQFVMLCADSRIRIFVLQVAWTCVPHRGISQHGATSYSARQSISATPLTVP